MSEAEFSVKLTPNEIVLLDGRCRPDVQSDVDKAKATLALAESGLSGSEAKMVAELVAVAKAKGRLTFMRCNIRTCPCCGRNDGYLKVSRSTRYKRKGDTDYDKPIRFSGFDCDAGFVIMDGYISKGFCGACQPRVVPVLLQQLVGIRAELPEGLTGRKPDFLRYDNKECTSCGWTGHEGQMLPVPALMGGHYKGRCPQCNVENRFMGRTIIKTVEGFTVVNAHD